jgi:endonuclease YncB( thermonuclease family)
MFPRSIPRRSRVDLGTLRPVLQEFLEHGWCGEVKVTRPAYDADTPTFSATDGLLSLRFRLIGVQAWELDEEGGLAGRDFVREKLREYVDRTTVWIPPPTHPDNPLADLTFGRIPAYVFLGDDGTLNEAIVKAGYGVACTKAECSRIRRSRKKKSA